MDDSKGEIAALGVSLNLQYAGGRTMVLQTHVPQDISKDDLNVLLDKFNAAGDRQEAYYAQEQARRQVEVEEKSLDNLMQRIAATDAEYQAKAAANPRRNNAVSEKEASERRLALAQVEEMKNRVRVSKAFLADLIQKAGNRDGANSGPNN